MDQIKFNKQAACLMNAESQTTVNTKPALREAFSYKFGLFVYDVVIMAAVAYLCVRFGKTAHQGVAPYATIIVLMAVMASSLFFFVTLKLYSYHLIYSIRFHALSLVHAFSSTGLAAFLVYLVLRIPNQLVDALLLPIVFVLTLCILVLHRYKWQGTIYLLYPVGFALLQLGLFGIAAQLLNTTAEINWHLVSTVVLLLVPVLTGGRLFLVHFVFNHLLRKRFRHQVAIVGTNASASRFTNHIVSLNAPFWIVGAVGLGTECACTNSRIANKGCIGGLNDLPKIVDEHNISDIVVTSEDIPKSVLIDLLDYCTSRGINAWFSPTLLPIIDVKLHIDRFCGKPMIRLCSQKNNWLFNKLKHGFDAVVTIPAFILQIPIFALIAAAIKVDSKGPVFYKAAAIGRNGKPFSMYKFRSMRTDTDAAIHKDYVTRLIEGKIESDASQGPLKITDDPRVTSVGRIIRKLSLDELPQLINVLKGEMSLVGPRPCLPYEFEVYQDWHKKRTVVRPGITGLWQVTGRSEVSFEEMILLDLYYIYNRNLLMDLKILFETIFVVLGKKGAF